MKRKIPAVIFLFYMGSFLSLHAQWAKTYGGAGKDEAYAIQQTSDGGYIVAGLTESFEDETGDVWIIKIDPNGNIEWQKTYGRGYLDAAYSIVQTYDGGYVIVGALAREGWTIWVLKLDAEGEFEWQKSFKGKEYEYGVAYSIQQTSDGGYIVAGEIRVEEGKDIDIWILKLAPDGTKEWDKRGGGSDLDHAYALQQTSDGGYIVAGQNDKPYYGVGGGIWVLKLHPTGEIEWQKTYGGDSSDEAHAIRQTNDGGYIVAGATHSFGVGDEDLWILKLNAHGDCEWQKTIGGEGQDYTRSIRQTFDGGYIVTGTTYSFGLGDGDLWILKLGTNGDIKWQRTYGGYGKEEAYSILQTYDGGYVVAGSTSTYGAGEEDFLVLKLFPNGEIGLPCEFEKVSNAKVQKTDVNPVDTNVIPADTNIVAYDPVITPKESDALVYSICLGQHSLDISTGSGGTTDPQPGVYVYYNADRIKISAMPEDTYIFSHWSGDAAGRENPLCITMDSDKSIQANFMEEFEAIWEAVKNTPCFIASAAYGSPSHPHVCILRDFKNEYLMTHKLGRKLVNVYYKYSPPVSDFITKNKFFKFPVRVSLQPFVTISYLMLTLGPILTGIMLFLIILSPFLLIFLSRKSGFLILSIIFISLLSCVTSPDHKQAKIYSSGLDSLMNRKSEEVSAQTTEEWGFVCTGIWKGENPAPDDVLEGNKGITAFTREEAEALFVSEGAYKVMHFMKYLRTEKVSIRTISSTGYTMVKDVGKTRDVDHHAFIRVIFRDDKLVHFKVWPCVEAQQIPSASLHVQSGKILYK